MNTREFDEKWSREEWEAAQERVHMALREMGVKANLFRSHSGRLKIGFDSMEDLDVEVYLKAKRLGLGEEMYEDWLGTTDLVPKHEDVVAMVRKY